MTFGSTPDTICLWCAWVITIGLLIALPTAGWFFIFMVERFIDLAGAAP